jgi:hypothetical protein
VLLLKDGRFKVGGPDASAGLHEWLGGNGLFTSTKEASFQVGKSRIQLGNEGGRILIYENEDGIGLLPMEGEFEIQSKTSRLKISAPFGVLLKDQKMQLTSRLSCDDPWEFINSGLEFTAECKAFSLSTLGMNQDALSGTFNPENTAAFAVTLGSNALVKEFQLAPSGD